MEKPLKIKTSEIHKEILAMREIEVKLRVKDLHVIAEKLAACGCVLSAPIRQHDTIYTPAGSTEEFSNAKEGDIIPRIRRGDGPTVEFNLKRQRSSEGDNIEYETEVKDADAIHGILVALGYKPEVEVKKVRRKGKLGEYEICLDDVEGLGTFVELEALVPDDADPNAVRENLFKALDPLGLSRTDEEVRGYDTLLFLKRRK